MNKTIPILLVLLLFSTLSSFSQDIVTLKTGEEIRAKVLEVSVSEIKYKRFDNLSGPIYVLPKSGIEKIEYENGTTEEMLSNKESVQPSIADDFGRYDPYVQLTESDLIEKGKSDAHLFYKGRKSGAGITLISTIVFSPVTGLIPAIGCSSSIPKDKNLHFANLELQQYPAYREAYRIEAFKIKKRVVWTNYGIGAGISAVAYWFLLGFLAK